MHAAAHASQDSRGLYGRVKQHRRGRKAHTAATHGEAGPCVTDHPLEQRIRADRNTLRL